MFAPLPAAAVDVTSTADNAYAFVYGTIDSANLSPAVVNTTSGEIFSCGFPGPEFYPNISNAAGNYIYIIAWSDQAVTQGVLDKFVESNRTIYTGSGSWEVYATGIPISPVTAASPTDAGNKVTWTNGGNILNTDYGSQFVIQTSTNLANWLNVPDSDPNLSNLIGSVSYTLTPGQGKAFLRLVVTPE